MAATRLTEADGLAFRLRRALRGEVRFDPGSRHLYATDASHYRQVPIGVVLPRDAEDVAATLEVCRELGAPVTTRGGGTSLAGQACNTAVVVDCSKHLRRVLDVDPGTRLARVEPGVVLSDLQRAAAPHGLRFGPDPSTSNRCTLGGMIGNNACGVHSVQAGRTADNVEALDVVLADGTRLTAGPTSEDELDRLAASGNRTGALYAGLRDLRDRVADEVRARFPDIPRRVSGFNLDELLPDRGFHVARALVGTEGTCAVVLGATVRLVEDVPYRSLVVLGYASIEAAGDAVPEVLACDPMGLEAIDANVVAGVARSPAGVGDLSLLPAGSAFLLVEFGGSSPAEARAGADDLLRRLGRSAGDPGVAVLGDPLAQQRLWELRRAGLGATAMVHGPYSPQSGWEDAAVPPARVGDYLRSLRALADGYDLHLAVFGHFGDGCLHTKFTFDHTTPGGVAAYRRFVEEAADLTVAVGGSLSGEHGDGQSRGELLERMFGATLVGAFREFKRLWDPDGLLNPGKVVDPRPLDADLRLRDALQRWKPATVFPFAGGFAQATAGCVGSGDCRRDDGVATMCPSWRATHDEEHSTRGRARLLFELLQPDAELDGWRDPHVREALDLCLSCKACKAECPVGVDMATMKAEFLHHHYRGRLRPTAAYALALSPWALRVAGRMPRTANRLGRGRLPRLAGLAPERPVPRLAEVGFRARFRQRPQARGERPTVLLFDDTFTERFEPHVGEAAVDVLDRAGYRVVLPRQPVCCGRPLYDAGMLTLARRQLRRLVDVLAPVAERDVPVVVLEPSCAAVFRDELVGLLPDDPRARRLSEATLTLAELLAADGWRPPRVSGRVLFHGHCHHEAVMGTAPDEALLDATGADVEVLDAGCCGLAGSFGFEAGEKYRLSVEIGEQRLLPAVRAAGEEAVVVTDGFSCRAQIAHLAGGRRALHLAEVLARPVALRE